jgi:hypothetical protein
MNTMNNLSMKSICTLLPLVGLSLAACSPQDTTPEQTAVQPAAPAQPFALAQPPAEAPSLLEALANAKEGESFLFSARIGGMAEPMMEDLAAFVVADEVLVFCDEMANPGHCPTPWDACCEDPDKIADARAFVQFLDAEGSPITANLREVIGMEENDTVIVKGRLSPDATAENPIILAEGLAIVD